MPSQRTYRLKIRRCT